MSNFLQESFGNKAEDLDDSNGGEGGSLKPREFFWDNIVLFVVSSIIGLAAIDVVTEFLRGGGVSCFPPIGVELSEAQGEYINGFCAGSLPPGAYIPAFMVIHAILIAIPHYLWLNHYGGNFDFFFQLTTSLKRLRDEESGEHVRENLIIVEQLETTFSTYRRNSIFYLYVAKLLLQLLWSVAGIIFVVWFFFQEFNANFTCPRDFVNTTSNPFWPLNEPVVCVFETLELLHTLWWAEIGLLALVSFGLFWALIWCASTHASELGAKHVAIFSFQSGLAPPFYVPPLPVPSCCKAGRKVLHRFFTSMPWLSLSGPRIQTDLDFLLMKLHRTDSGLGHVFKEVQIEKELKVLIDDDQRRLSLHGSKQKNLLAKDVPLDKQRDKDHRDRDQDEQDLKWRFSKVERKLGIYRDFKTLPDTQRLLLTDTMRGAVLAFGQRAPHNKSAISISFGDTGYATALARVFQRVALLNFSPYYDSSEEVVTTTQYRTSMVSLVYAEDVLSSATKDVNEFVEKLKTIWVPPGSSPQFSETSFIVVGPIPREKDFNVTNVDLLFENIHGCLEKGAVLLTIRPLEIAGKYVGDEFLRYEASEPHFLPLRQEQPSFPTNRSSGTEWPARKSVLEPPTGSKATPKASEATPTGVGQAIALQNLQSPQTEKDTLLSTSSITLESNPSPSPPVEEHPFRFPVTVRCGQTKARVEFSTYYYTDAAKVRRPKMFDPPKKKTTSQAAPVSQKTTPTVEVVNDDKKSGVVKEKNVNVQV